MCVCQSFLLGKCPVKKCKCIRPLCVHYFLYFSQIMMLAVITSRASFPGCIHMNKMYILQVYLDTSVVFYGTISVSIIFTHVLFAYVVTQILNDSIVSTIITLNNRQYYTNNNYRVLYKKQFLVIAFISQYYKKTLLAPYKSSNDKHCSTFQHLLQ